MIPGPTGVGKDGDFSRGRLGKKLRGCRLHQGRSHEVHRGSVMSARRRRRLFAISSKFGNSRQKNPASQKPRMCRPGRKKTPARNRGNSIAASATIPAGPRGRRFVSTRKNWARRANNDKGKSRVRDANPPGEALPMLEKFRHGARGARWGAILDRRDHLRQKMGATDQKTRPPGPLRITRGPPASNEEFVFPNKDGWIATSWCRRRFQCGRE